MMHMNLQKTLEALNTQHGMWLYTGVESTAASCFPVVYRGLLPLWKCLLSFSADVVVAI